MSNCRLQRYERRQSARPVGDANFPVYGLDQGEFTEGRELDRKWRVPHCPKTPRNAAAQIFNAIKFRVLDRV